MSVGIVGMSSHSASMNRRNLPSSASIRRQDVWIAMRSEAPDADTAAEENANSTP